MTRTPHAGGAPGPRPDTNALKGWEMRSRNGTARAGTPCRRVRGLSDEQVNARQSGTKSGSSTEFRAAIGDAPASLLELLGSPAALADALERTHLAGRYYALVPKTRSTIRPAETALLTLSGFRRQAEKRRQQKPTSPDP